MTWLSRLLPQSPSLQRRADHNNRTRQAQRRRRMATLESLEGRTLLSNITVAQNPSTNVVSIVGDTHGDQFKVTVTPTNYITVVGTDAKTQVDGFPVGQSWTSLYPALGLTISLPGSSNVSDVVALQGQGTATASDLKSISVTVTGTVPLSFTADDIRTISPGGFTLTDGTASVAGGQLSAYVANSQFSSLTIYQTGCCNAYAELDNDTVAGAVSVTEGLANKDGIVLDGTATGSGLLDVSPTSWDSFGSTVLTQGVGPGSATATCCNGNSDYVHVDDANLKDLTITQPSGIGLNGNINGQGNTIEVGFYSPVEVSNASFGIVATQGDGNGDTILIVSISTLGPALNSPHGGPDSIITSQGNGNCDSVQVDSSFVWGNIESSQLNGNFDSALYTGDKAGWSTKAGSTITDMFGLASITQLNGYNDTATLDCSQIELKPGKIPDVFNNVQIFQGASYTFLGCTPGYGDVINVNCTYVVSDMTLEQGVGDTTGAGFGNNVVNVGTTMAVRVGDNTVIQEIGSNNGNNSIYLGGANLPDNAFLPHTKPDFESGYLDVYTGDAGGAYVQVYNTLVDVPGGVQGLFGPFNINGDAALDGDTSVIDDYSALTVTSAF